MELVFLAAGLNTLLPRLWVNREDKEKKRSAIDANIKDISRESKRLKVSLENAKFNGDGSSGAMDLKRDARELSQETRDCIQRFLKDENASCTKFANDTEGYSKAIQVLWGRVDGHKSMAYDKPEDPYVANPMHMDELVKELLDLVELSDGRRKVISIVGLPGLGKTLLANQVYDEEERRAREARELSPDTPDCILLAWVTAAAKDAKKVLTEILDKFDSTEGKHANQNLRNLSRILAERLRKKRYLIVIDDMQSIEQWTGMKGAFPKDADGTIMVTTTIQPVANVCSPCNRYMYKLSPLDEDNSLDLFLKGTTWWDRHLMKEYESYILDKCDGLPLAIVSISQFLEGRGVRTSDECRAACTQLGGNLVHEGGGLERLRWVLMNKYTGLTCDAIRSCLLYYCMYKHNMDAVPRRNSLMRRWDAEGFLVPKLGFRRPMDVAAENLKTLVDHNIIQSMEVGTNGSIRRCRPPGMMVEYISQISMFENFAALVSDEVPCDIRRVSFHPGSATDDNKISGMKLQNVLTLAVSGIGCKAILDFGKYDLIAVLDLKECTNLTQDHVIAICKLLLLKYLSLGDSIRKIPSEMENLKLLETLEMRRNETVCVYAEVLKLPNLKHLIGKFELKHKPDKGLESGLETVTGFVSERVAGGFPLPQLMKHMKMLRKVKIHCSPTASETDQQDLQREIKAFTSESTNVLRCDRSLSIDFAEFTKSIDEVRSDRSLSVDLAGLGIQPMRSKRFLNAVEPSKKDSIPSPLEFLEEDGRLDSLKLRSNWTPFSQENGNKWTIPDFTKISGIRKLCLSRSYKRGIDVLDGLTNLIALEYLKLDEEDLGPLVITAGTFQNLTRLCLVGETSLQGITIEHQALPKLVSLHLICKDLHRGIESSIGSGRVKCLAEIALDSEVHKDTKGAWKTAAKGHPNRPQVLLIKKGAPIRQA